jgi:transposase
VVTPRFYLQNIWFDEQSKQAAKLFNNVLDLQMNLLCNGEKIKSRYDLAEQFRGFELGSDFKDKIYERISISFEKWIKSEKFRYQLYWQSKEKDFDIPEMQKQASSKKYPFLKQVEKDIFQKQELHQFVKRLSRKQILVGRPRKRKTCSLAFAIRANRQSTVRILKNKIDIVIPKYQGSFSGRYNFLPSSSSAKYKLATIKRDNCGTLWMKLTYEEEIKISSIGVKEPKISVGIDMGLKTTRTAVAVNHITKEIVEVYQPERVRYFEQGLQALIWASTKDTRHLPYVHRKIARRRLDNINKDIVKILDMGDEFKFGKPSAAFLFSGKLARSAADAANSCFLTRFAKRAELAGKESGEVNESYTSVTCRKCLETKAMPLFLRIYECSYCGHVEDRDINSGYQIAFRDFFDRDKGQKAACFPAVR